MKKKIEENYLERKPKRAEHIIWKKDNEGKVIFEIENRGIFNRVAQILLKKPRISYIHLDEMGSFIWPLLDGEKNIVELGKAVEDEFKDKAYPLYERLAKYFQILDSYGFIRWNKD